MTEVVNGLIRKILRKDQKGQKETRSVETNAEKARNLYNYVLKHGMADFYLPKGFSLDKTNAPVIYKKVILGDEKSQKKFNLIAMLGNDKSPEEPNIQISDHKVENGVERLLCFNGKSFALFEARQYEKKEGRIIFDSGKQMSQEERTIFLNEVVQSLANAKSTDKTL